MSVKTTGVVGVVGACPRQDETTQKLTNTCRKKPARGGAILANAGPVATAQELPSLSFLGLDRTPGRSTRLKVLSTAAIIGCFKGKFPGLLVVRWGTTISHESVLLEILPGRTGRPLTYNQGCAKG